MKVGIVTVYNSLNCGSFLQSYALQTILEQMGYEAFFVDAKTRKPLKVTVAKAINALKKFDFSLCIYLFQEYFSYYRALKLLNVDHNTLDNKETYYVLGSDEIWNVKRLQMKEFPIFWGEGLPLDRCISYAPSINNSKADDFYDISSFQHNIRQLHAVSVRDNISYSELKKIFPELGISICCDPTVLLEKKDYDVLDKHIGQGEFVFVYDYDRKREKENEAIIRFANEKGLKLVIMGEQSWGDVRIPRDPYSFISLIRSAKYVITGTFHGTMFSILNGKQFASIARTNKKIYEILDEYGLSDRVFDQDGNKTLTEILDTPYDLSKVKEILEIKKHRGKAFLQEALKMEK